MPFLEVGPQVSRHAFFHLQLVYDVECYRLGFGIVRARITLFKVRKAQVTF